MSWQGVAGSLIDLTRDFRIVWDVRSGHVNHSSQATSWWQARVGSFIFRLEEVPGGLSVEHNDIVRTVQCNETARISLAELIRRTRATDDATMRVHVDTVLRRICQRGE